jgi:DNA-binding transcriptional MerR regulator
MKRYEQKITEVGLNKGTVSTKIKNMIREFKEGEAELAEMQKAYDAEEAGEAKDDLKAKIEEFAKTLEDYEDQIIAKIEDFARKKPMFDDNIKRMQEARKAKAAAKAEATGQAPVEVVTAPEPALIAPPVAEPVAAPAPAQPEVISVVAEEVKEEKKSGGGNWIFAGILTVAAVLIGVNFVRNRN